MTLRTNILTGLFLLLSLPITAVAKVSGPCVNCHTMHNSQNGQPMAFSLNSSLTPTPQTSPNGALLNTDCIGCHEGTNSGGTTPYVLDTSGPNYGATGTTGDTLAGGNFYWVSLNERTGHNVAGLPNTDTVHGNTPPGSITALSSQLTCAGVVGCHGSTTQSNQTLAVFGSHHNNNKTIWNDGLTTATSYRFIDGVLGVESSNYEYQPTSANHNKYYGVDRNSEADVSGTISSHCARCHNNFHNGNAQISAGVVSNNVWLRHPTDFDMSKASLENSEYTFYNGGTGTSNPYSVVTPVATDDYNNTAINSVVYDPAKTNDAIVMCLSCHRSHGTPYNSILRWDYKNWPGSGTNGCAICHTAKN